MTHQTRARHTRPERRVWQLAALMAVAAAAITVPGFSRLPQSALPTAAWGILVPLFALAEVLVIHLPAERSSHSPSLREIPAMVGLTFLSSVAVRLRLSSWAPASPWSRGRDCGG